MWGDKGLVGTVARLIGKGLDVLIDAVPMVLRNSRH